MTHFDNSHSVWNERKKNALFEVNSSFLEKNYYHLFNNRNLKMYEKRLSELPYIMFTWVIRSDFTVFGFVIHQLRNG